MMRLSKHTLAYAGILLLLLSSLFFTVLDIQAAPATQEAQPVVLYFFWGDGCPHCAQEKPFLEELKGRYPNLEVRDYEIYNVPKTAMFSCRWLPRWASRRAACPRPSSARRTG